MRLLLVLSLLGAMSCKTSSSRSKLDAAAWMDGDLAKLIYFENDTFIVNSCPAPKDGEMREALRNKKDLEEIKKICNQTSTPVSPSALKAALTEEILAPADTKLGATKSERLKAIPRQIAELKMSLNVEEEILAAIDEELVDIVAAETVGLVKKLRQNLSDLDSEFKSIEQAMNDPGKLKSIDISTTLALQSKIASNAVEQADLLVDLLRDVKVYTLDMERNTTLVTALQRFAPACSHGMSVGESKSVNRGVERLDVVCEKNGIVKVLQTNCTLPGYELVNSRRGGKSCVFRAGKTSIASLVATHDGICGLNSKGEMSCWGKVGQFPLNIDLGSLNRNSNRRGDLLQGLTASAQQLCAFNRAGGINSCWPSSGERPPMSQKFVKVAGGETHMCGITDAGEVKCWGENNFKQKEIPQGISDAKQISTLENVTCIIDGQSKLKCWGEQVDKVGFDPSNIPSIIDTVNSVSVGPQHICTIDSQQKVLCWGEETDAKRVPDDLNESVFVQAGRFESCAISKQGDLRCWGSAPRESSYKSAPALKNVKSVVVSRFGANFCAIYDEDRKLACWGRETYNEQFKFEAPSDLRNVTAVAITTSGYACAVSNNSQLSCFGNTSDIPSPSTKF